MAKPSSRKRINYALMTKKSLVGLTLEDTRLAKNRYTTVQLREATCFVVNFAHRDVVM